MKHRTRASERLVNGGAGAFLGLSAIVFAAALSSEAWTQAPQPTDASVSPLTGTWELAIPEAQARERLNRAIDVAVDGLPPIVDGIAAGQLRSRIPLSHRVEITLSDARIVVRFDNAVYDTAPGASETCPMAGNPSETVDVIQHLREGHLEQVFSTSGGRRWNTFSPSDDGDTLAYRIVVQSERLPGQMRFELPYRRALAVRE